MNRARGAATLRGSAAAAMLLGLLSTAGCSDPPPKRRARPSAPAAAPAAATVDSIYDEEGRLRESKIEIEGLNARKRTESGPGAVLTLHARTSVASSAAAILALADMGVWLND